MNVFQLLEKLFGRKKPDSRLAETGTGTEDSKASAEADWRPVHQKSREDELPPIRSSASSQASHDIIAASKMEPKAEPPATSSAAEASVEVPAHLKTSVSGLQERTAIAAKAEPAKLPPDKAARAAALSQATTARVVQRRVSVAPGREQRKTSVYIGLDFGTTFTKAAYEIAPSGVHTKYSVRFGNSGAQDDYYLPSILYFNPETKALRISDHTGQCEVVRYFKYSIISDALKKNEVLRQNGLVTKTPIEQLCCVFFLSHVISVIRDEVSRKFGSETINAATTWYVNMGVPLEAHKDDKRALLYKKVLEIACLLEATRHGQTEISISELDAFYVANMDKSNPRINILPEIYAEVLLYQQYLNTPAGFYTVVDIGGGTEDIATFLKTSDSFNEKVECLAQGVIGYGFDSIAERIVQSIDAKSVRTAKSFLDDAGIDFNVDAVLQAAMPSTLDYSEVIAARLKCRTLVGACLQRARKTKVDVLEQAVANRLPMHIFIMGGARNVAFYRVSIEFMKRAQENAGIPYFKDADVFDYVGRNTQFEIRHDQRLIISQMLAQPFELIPEIENMPWNLKESNVASRGMSWIDMRALQDELYPD